MYIPYIVLAVIVSFLLVFSGRSMLVKDKDIVETLTRLGVPSSWYYITLNRSPATYEIHRNLGLTGRAVPKAA
ncbi:hypothetical protein O3S80_37530 [Streptomyces sp. Lzd4kr]|nr:hypothetical protein [Streptomyces sp. Lzd4kr]